MRAILRRDLAAALKARDRDAAGALRSALAAIDNAEALNLDGQAPIVAEHQHVAGSAAGLGATEIARRHLSGSELRAIMATEVDDRMDAAAGYERNGHTERAQRLRSEADVLRRYLPRVHEQ